MLWTAIFSILQRRGLTRTVSEGSKEQAIVVTNIVEGTLSLNASPRNAPTLALGFAQPYEEKGPSNLKWLFHSGSLIQGHPFPPLSCVVTSVTLLFTATRTRVTPQPHPESKYQNSEPLPKPCPGPTGHSQAGPARLPNIAAAGIFITNFGSKGGGNQNRGATSATMCLILHAVANTGAWSPPGLAQGKPYHTKFFLGRSRVSEA